MSGFIVSKVFFPQGSFNLSFSVNTTDPNLTSGFTFALFRNEQFPLFRIIFGGATNNIHANVYNDSTGELVGSIPLTVSWTVPTVRTWYTLDLCHNYLQLDDTFGFRQVFDLTESQLSQINSLVLESSSNIAIQMFQYQLSQNTTCVNTLNTEMITLIVITAILAFLFLTGLIIAACLTVQRNQNTLSI